MLKICHVAWVIHKMWKLANICLKQMEMIVFIIYLGLFETDGNEVNMLPPFCQILEGLKKAFWRVLTSLHLAQPRKGSILLTQGMWKGHTLRVWCRLPTMMHQRLIFTTRYRDNFTISPRLPFTDLSTFTSLHLLLPYHTRNCLFNYQLLALHQPFLTPIKLH